MLVSICGSVWQGGKWGVIKSGMKKRMKRSQKKKKKKKKREREMRFGKWCSLKGKKGLRYSSRKAYHRPRLLEEDTHGAL